MFNKIEKNYNQLTHKLQTNFEDTKRLIALHNELLKKIDELNKRVEELWTLTNSTYEGV